MLQKRQLGFTALILGLLCGSAQAYLHSRQGRFLQRDSLGYVDGMGLYEYVRSRPTVGSDWSGRQAAALPAISGPTGLMAAVATAYAKYKAVFTLTTAITAAAIAGSESGLFETKLALQNLGLEDAAIKKWAREAQRALDEWAQKLAAKDKPRPVPVPIAKENCEKKDRGRRKRTCICECWQYTPGTPGSPGEREVEPQTWEAGSDGQCKFRCIYLGYHGGRCIPGI